MFNRSKNLTFTLALLAAALLGSSLVQGREIRLGHNGPTNDPRHESLVEFADLISKRTKGDITIKIFPGDTLGKDRERIEQLQGGLLELSLAGEILENFDPRWSIISMPYMWDDKAHLDRFLESSMVQGWVEESVKKSGLRILSFLERNPRILTTRDKAVNSIADMRGIKLRVPSINSYMDTWRAFGVEPTPMSSSEFFLALKTGTIDGMENPIEVMYSWKVYEVSKHLSYTNHVLSRLYLLASAKFMDSLTPEQRKIFIDTAREVDDNHAKRGNLLAGDYEKKLIEKGMVINKNPDLSGFKAASKSVHAKYMKDFGKDAYDLAQSLAKKK